MESQTLLRQMLDKLKPMVRFHSTHNLADWSMPKLSAAVFALGFLVFLMTQLYLVVSPITARSVPVEADDAYTYIIKAAQLQECPLQDCQALEDLREQSGPVDDPDLTWQRRRIYGRAFVVYHPLHSVAMVALHAVGLSWESAYNGIQAAGAVLISIGVAGLVYALVGAEAGGITLVLLSLVIFPDQGLDNVVPSNLTLGIALLLWSAILLRGQKLSLWVVVGGITLMLFTHTIGRLYAVISLALYVLNVPFPPNRKQIVYLGAVSVLIGLVAISPNIITRPELSIPLEQPVEGLSWFDGVKANFAQMWDYIRDWAERYGGSIVVGVLSVIGFVAVSPLHRERLVIFGGLIAGLLLASLFYVVPLYPAIAANRVWIPLAIVITCLMGAALAFWIKVAIKWVKQVFSPDKKDGSVRWGLPTPMWILAALILSGVFLARYGYASAKSGIRQHQERVELKNTRYSIALDASQPEYLEALGTDCGTVAYFAEVPFFFYLTHGTLNCGAVYYPSIAGTEDEERLLVDNEDVHYLVNANPIQQLESLQNGGVNLVGTQAIGIAIRSEATFQLNLLIDNPAGAAEIMLLDDENGSQSVISVPANTAGWFQSDELSAETRELVIKVDGRDAPLLLRGIRLGDNVDLDWPWEQGIALVYSGNDGGVEIPFEIDELFPMMSDHELKILEDSGISILVEVMPQR